MELQQSRETESTQRRSNRPSTGRGLLHKGKSDTLIAASSSIERKINNWELSNSAQRISSRKSGNLINEEQYSERAFINRAGSSTASNHQSVLSLAVAGPVFFSNVDLARGSSVSDAMKWEEDAQMDMEMDNADMDYKPDNAATIGIPSLSSPPPLSLKFVDVTYRVALEYDTSTRLCPLIRKSERKNVKEKEILHGITGYVMPGEVMALMGPSGSGKTTLINLLSGRVAASKSKQDGLITYNDMPYSKALKRRMGFVMQDDVLYPHLTVKETLVYAALLRLSKKLSKNEKIERAIEVIYELGLERCQDTVIGGPFLRGVSGGERKRVCMGQEILTDPSLLFLDEPTSGLDSTTALRIVHVLRQISQVGRTVITTIHQPSSRLFHMFDKLILLSEGHLIYFGKAAEAVSYFKSIGFSPRIAMNPADFLLDLASGNASDISLPLDLMERQQANDQNQLTNGGTISVSSGRPSAKQIRQYLYKSYEVKVQPQEKRKLMLEQELAEQAGVSNPDLAGETNSREWSSSWWSQFSVLYVRGLRERRHEYLSWLRVTQVIVSALAIGCLWWQSRLQTERQVSDQVGLLFFIATYWGFFPLFTALFTFPQERAILAKERASDMYRLSSYFMARTLSDLPLDFGLPVVFHIIVYFMTRLRQDATAFFLTLLIILLSTITSQGMGIAIGAAMMDLKKATTLASVVLLTFMLSGGYFVQSIPQFMLWLRHISYNNYTFKLLVKVQYDAKQLYDCHSRNGCKSIADSPSLIDIPLSGGVKESMILLAMVFGYRLLAYVALRRMKTTV